jgi:hypothetical protein
LARYVELIKAEAVAQWRQYHRQASYYVRLMA